MLQGITDVLTSIGEFFSSIVDFVGGLIQDLVNFVTSLATVGSDIGTFLSGIPVYVVTGILSLVALMIVLRVVGRD